MRKIDSYGLHLCETQAKAFEMSSYVMENSSEIFIRRFMNSNVASEIDENIYYERSLTGSDLLDDITEQYGISNYGKVKYTGNELYWMGYLYRYMAYTYALSSKQVYKLVKPSELRKLYEPYHTMDTAAAIERILESKNMLLDEEGELQRQYEIFKRIRQGKSKE